MTAFFPVGTARPAVERHLTTVVSDGPNCLFNFVSRNEMTNLKKHKLNTTFRFLVVFEMAAHYFCISMLLERQGKVEILIFRTVQNHIAAWQRMRDERNAENTERCGRSLLQYVFGAYARM
jgi:hypothetical protein